MRQEYGYARELLGFRLKGERMNKCDRTLPAIFFYAALLLLGASATVALTHAQQSPSSGKTGATAGCPTNDSGLKLPKGFCATIFADGS